MDRCGADCFEVGGWRPSYVGACCVSCDVLTAAICLHGIMQDVKLGWGGGWVVGGEVLKKITQF